ncbi:hypothetical protein CEXT_169351 [Caerostris extrusa]|uniref:THAP-type domain-containing protein n=1 Tax=Caerostris extrusa TaxID=172846 RepID=A0AAV4Q5P0_CAEEX|nr:hypothetical protein CEXT_169351 [Caerostris extrusa]
MAADTVQRTQIGQLHTQKETPDHIIAGWVFYEVSGGEHRELRVAKTPDRGQQRGKKRSGKRRNLGHERVEMAKSVVFHAESNYDQQFTFLVFKLPKEEDRRNLWLKKINRKDYFTGSKNTVVCIKHFSEKFVITEDHAIRDDGSILTCERIYPKLTPDAYPSIFQICYILPSDLPLYRKRKTPSEQKK